jgi:flap endonuclease-1
MLCGCDYLEPIKGVGPKTALKLVKDYETMEEILEHLAHGKTKVPEDWPWEEAKKLFTNPNVTPAKDVEVSSTVPSMWEWD